MIDLPSPKVLQHLVDVHCHPTDALVITAESMERLRIKICAMSTKQSDQQLVYDLAQRYPDKVLPCFGHHPWFTYLISTQPSATKVEHFRKLFLSTSTETPERRDAFEALLPLLPDPIPLENVLMQLRVNFKVFPEAMLGEVGLDRTFRVPYDYYASPRKLTPFTIPLGHQLAVLQAQLDLAIELGRNVSFHSVNATQATLDLLVTMAERHGERWKQINVDMHSCGMKPEAWREVERKHSNLYLSLSTVINGRSANHRALIAACSPDRILVESDYNDVDKCTEKTWEILQTVARIKGWRIEDEDDWDDLSDGEKPMGAIRKLEQNWFAFMRHSLFPGT